MTPRQASRAIWQYQLRMDRRGCHLARILAPIANIWTDKDSKTIEPYDLWPSPKLKPEELEKEERKQVAEETFKEMGIGQLSSPHTGEE